jgi:putative phosphoribosyl transferase
MVMAFGMRVFRNRQEAGRLLAEAVSGYAGAGTVVVGLPRGGVPVAFEVARTLGAPLDVFVVRKLGVPFQPELAMGAIASGGVLVRNESVLELLPDAGEALERARRREEPVLAERERRYRGARPPVDPSGRTVIVVDDGIATGSTMKAAVRALKAAGAQRVVVAVPVAPPDTLRELESLADEVVCLQAPRMFSAVGQWYEDFSQTEDDEVERLLALNS